MGTITDGGLNEIAKKINGASPGAVFNYIALGTSAQAENPADVSLAAENTLYGAARKIANVASFSPGGITWNTTFQFTGPVTVREIGIFNAPSGGTILYRWVLAANRVYNDGDGVQVNVTLQLARG